MWIGSRQKCQRKMLSFNRRKWWLTAKNIRQYVVGTKFKELTGNHELTDEQAQKMIDMLDEVSVKGVLKGFNEEVRKKLATNKRK